jgi:hypothetical protein
MPRPGITTPAGWSTLARWPDPARCPAGRPFADTGKVVQLGTLSDIELGEVDIGGFLLIEAESAEAAVQIAEQAPHITLGGSVIVRPCLEVPRP